DAAAPDPHHRWRPGDARDVALRCDARAHQLSSPRRRPSHAAAATLPLQEEMNVFSRTVRADTWTRERLDQLGRQELLNLRDNAIWQAAVQTIDGACVCLLWAPNTDGARPWSESAAGRERLEHCKLAMERQGAEGLLVHGEPLEGRLPEDRARTVLGIDAETV